MYGTVLPDNRLQITQWVGSRPPAVQDLIIEPGSGVGGRVVSTRRAVGVSDYIRANTISHKNDRYIQDEGLHSIVAVPVIVQREIEHTSVLQSRFEIVCRLLLEKKKKSECQIEQIL